LVASDTQTAATTTTGHSTIGQWWYYYYNNINYHDDTTIFYNIVRYDHPVRHQGLFCHGQYQRVEFRHVGIDRYRQYGRDASGGWSTHDGFVQQ
jgi:hypothetical protein